jgi:hypothetical protein
MARRGQEPRSNEPRERAPRKKPPLPAPLPPETRTVGQLVAETIRLYGERFWASLPLGLPVAAVDQIVIGGTRVEAVVVWCVAGPVLALAYARACLIVTRGSADRRAWLVAIGSGALVFVPAGVLLPWFSLGATCWLGVFGFVVPAAMVERLSFRRVFPRTVELARADLIHAIGGLATFVLLFGVTQRLLLSVLHTQADNAIRTSIVLADVVIAPLLFLGPVLLHGDQAARLGSPGRRSRRSDADLPDVDDAHGEGRADAQLQPGAPS